MKTLVPVALFAMIVAFACGPKLPPEGPRKQNEIQALWTQIRDWRLEAGLPVDQAPSELYGVGPMTVQQVQQICPENHAVPPACSDVCSLADAICDNAEQICILADELGKQDTWAQDKCTSAKGSCREAKKKCCGKCSETKVDAPAPSSKRVTPSAPAPLLSTPAAKDHAS
ncbi:MAG TPA: hypothetical protein VL326_12465 [Kofleriaceae bacterium]|nr:hypothetical protein [Kofleriaceae bacterium]